MICAAVWKAGWPGTDTDMAVTSDIIRTWRAPRDVARDLLGMGPREDRALIYLMAACLLLWVAQLPRLAREAYLTGEPRDQLIGTALYVWLFFAPLGLYLASLLLQGVMRLMGAGVAGARIRIVLFWALLAATPVALLHGLLLGLSGPGIGADLVGVAGLAAFMLFAALGLREAATP
jgi:hypothetical protein